jgi:hypothetical protein
MLVTFALAAPVLGAMQATFALAPVLVGYATAKAQGIGLPTFALSSPVPHRGTARAAVVAGPPP